MWDRNFAFQYFGEVKRNAHPNPVLRSQPPKEGRRVLVTLCAFVVLADVALFRYAPDRRWRIETLITMLSIAGNHCNEVSSMLCARP